MLMFIKIINIIIIITDVQLNYGYLGDSGRNDTYADLGHKLDTDTCFGTGRLKVIDQL